MDGSATPVLLVGAGHMGGALIAGWLCAGALAAGDLIIQDPHPGEAARRAAEFGASLNSPLEELAAARTVVLAIKPQAWRPIVEAISPHLAPAAVIISIMAGVPARDIAAASRGRPIARVMPTTAAAVCRGTASVWALEAAARARAHALFASLGEVVDLESEALLHVAAAASGSAPAYAYALVEALAHAGEASGLTHEAARTLSRGALIGAAALLETTGKDAGELRRQVTSPGGTTEAALGVLGANGALNGLVRRAVAAAADRSRQLGGGG